MPVNRKRVAEQNALIEEENDDDYSDEIEDELEEDDASGELDTSGRLNNPTAWNRTLKELYGTQLILCSRLIIELLKDERYMNVNPDYQREVVWNDKRQVDLIDSFFNNYYVPPVIFKAVS